MIKDEECHIPVLQATRVLPPNVLIKIFQYLPVPSLAQVALVSRRFKVLVYDDEIWDSKLRIMLENDTGALAAMLGKSVHNTIKHPLLFEITTMLTLLKREKIQLAHSLIPKIQFISIVNH